MVVEAVTDDSHSNICDYGEGSQNIILDPKFLRFRSHDIYGWRKSNLTFKMLDLSRKERESLNIIKGYVCCFSMVSLYNDKSKTHVMNDCRVATQPLVLVEH